jgi:predicted NAD-dependent protein-ADP-ribosyltransferase YbiA (DUF1768 family)
MKVITKSEMLIFVPETLSETEQLAQWKEGRESTVLALQNQSGSGIALRTLGDRAEVCREPIQVSSRSADPQVRLIGNFAPTPFDLDGVHHACVEAFWQSLRFPEAERRRIAALDGSQAKQASREREYGATVRYRGEEIPVGTWAHWQLMERACWAKFTQHWEAQAALVGTGERPLVHRMRRDSKTIPGVIMADIWMRIRRGLQQRAGKPLSESVETPSDPMSDQTTDDEAEG